MFVFGSTGRGVHNTCKRPATDKEQVHFCQTVLEMESFRWRSCGLELKPLLAYHLWGH